MKPVRSKDQKLKIVVVGGAGFIGSNFVRRVVNNECIEIVSVIDNGSYAADFTRIDDLDLKILKNSLNLVPWAYYFDQVKPDVIINFAAHTHVDNSIHDVRPFIDSNYNGVAKLLDGILGYKKTSGKSVKLVQISTDEVYGDLSIKSRSTFNECSGLAPNNPYASTKAAADLMIRAYVKTHGLNCTILRSVNNYGPFQHFEKFIPVVVNKILDTELIPVYGNGKNIREWLYVDDFARGIESVICAGAKTDKKVYNFGSTTRKNNLELVKEILDLMKKPHSFISFVEDRKGHDRKYAMDWFKVNNELQWKPQVDFTVGLEKTIKHIEESRR